MSSDEITASDPRTIRYARELREVAASMVTAFDKYLAVMTGETTEEVEVVLYDREVMDQVVAFVDGVIHPIGESSTAKRERRRLARRSAVRT